MFDEQPDGDLHGECAAEIARLRTALAELVAVKDLKERTEALHFAGPSGMAGDGWKDLYEAGRRDYLRRQPAAWDAARQALTPTPEESTCCPNLKSTRS